MAAWMLGWIRGNDVADGTTTVVDMDKATSISHLKKVSGIADDIYMGQATNTYLYSSEISRLAAHDIFNNLEMAFQKVARSDSGMTKKMWLDSLIEKEILTKAQLGENPRLWDTIFRTNNQLANQAANYEEILRNQDVYYALQYLAIEDERTTPLCSSLDGTIQPFGSGFWETFWPPNHFACRSDVGRITNAEAEVTGISMTQVPIDIPEMQDSFKGNPINQWAQLPESTKERARSYGILADMDRRAREIARDFDGIIRRAEL